MYIQQEDQLDLIKTCHVEIVSSELKANILFKQNKEKDILPGFFGSIATRTIGDASKWRPVNDGQNIFVDNVADFNTRESNCPIAKLNLIN